MNLASLISLSNVSYTYNKGKPNAVTALKNVSLSVEKGEFVAVTGVSGSGKSTLLHILSGLIKPEEGQYSFAGQDVCRLTEKGLATLRNNYFGYVLQNFGLIKDRTALENVCLPLMFSKLRWKDIEPRGLNCLERMGVIKLSGKLVREMSGGQCQRIAIARALVNNPQLILADEPTGALDTKNSEQFMDLMQEINHSGVTIIMVTHDMTLAEKCLRKIKIADGCIIG